MQKQMITDATHHMHGRSNVIHIVMQSVRTSASFNAVVEIEMVSDPEPFRSSKYEIVVWQGSQ